jgi:hypothetical protein
VKTVKMHAFYTGIVSTEYKINYVLSQKNARGLRNMKTADRSPENVAHLKYLEMAVTNQNLIKN